MRYLLSLTGAIHAPFHRGVFSAAIICVLTCIAGRGSATPISSLFNTGVDGAAIALPAGTVDPHYKLIYSDSPSAPIPTAHVAGTLPPGWAGESVGSRWIIPGVGSGFSTPATAAPAGTYMYELTFNVSDPNPALVSISGKWSAADVGLIQLNGTYVPGTLNVAGPGVLTSFTIPAGSGFVAGENRLDFVVVSSAAGQPGVQVQFVPEPGAIALATIGVILAGCLTRRQRVKQSLP